MLKTTLVLVIEHSKPIPELTDLAAGRIYTLDGVEDVTAFAEQARTEEIRARLNKVSNFWAGYRRYNEKWQDAHADEAQQMVDELEAVIAVMALQSTREAA